MVIFASLDENIENEKKRSKEEKEEGENVTKRQRRRVEYCSRNYVSRRSKKKTKTEKER